MKQTFKLVAICFLTLVSSLAAKEEKYVNTFVESVKDINRRIFPGRFFSWSTNGMREWIEQLNEISTNPNQGVYRVGAFEFFQDHKGCLSDATSSILNSSTWEDLDFFCGGADKSRYFASQICRAQTELGRVLLYMTLVSPAYRGEAFEKTVQRQQAIKRLVGDADLFERIVEQQCQISKTESSMLSVFSRFSFKQSASNIIFTTPGFTKLNSSSTSLQVKSVLDKQKQFLGVAMTALAGVLLPAYGLTKLSGNKLPDWLDSQAISQRNHGDAIMSAASFCYSGLDETLDNHSWLNAFISIGAGVYSALTIKPQLRWLKDAAFLEKSIHAKLITIASYLEGVRNIHAIVTRHPDFADTLASFHHLDHLFTRRPQELADLKTLFDELDTWTFKGKASYVTYHGRVLATFNLLHELKDEFVMALKAVAEIDMLVGMARLIKEREGMPARYSFAAFAKSSSPHIELEGVWNPFIDPEVVVTNDVSFGGETKNNGIITGPNAAGKSTVMKSVALALIMAQAFGVAPARSAIITPFARIATYLNITDDIGVGNSLFKSEVLRAQKLIDTVQGLGDGEFSFTIIDEMFSGTSPVEGAAAAYAVGKHLADYDNSICLIASHFPLLTQLEDETRSFNNYCVGVQVGRDGSLKYPFTLERGISTQNIALDILRDQGFDNTILQTAVEVVTKG